MSPNSRKILKSAALRWPWFALCTGIAFAATAVTAAANLWTYAIVMATVATAFAFSTIILMSFLVLNSVVQGRKRLEATLAKDRKDASRWEWAIDQKVTALAQGKRATTPPPAKSPAAEATSRSWKNHPRAAALLESGIFDAQYYARVSGGSFKRDEDTASHFLSIGYAKLHSCSPYIAPETFTPELRNIWRGGDFEQFVRELRSNPALQLGPHFHTALMQGDQELWSKHVGGALGWFREFASDDTPLPRPGRRIFKSDFEREVVAAIEDHRASKDLSRSRLTTSWDEKREAEWKASTLAAPLPDSDALISVIMPAWNRADVIKHAIRSVQEQSYGAWELIVVDDGSTDGTAAVVNELSQENSRIQLIPAEHGGVCAARNRGLEVAHGSFVAFLDTDNTWEPDFLELMIRGLTTANVGFGYSAIELKRDESTMYRAFNGGSNELSVLNHIDLNVLVARTDLAREVGGFNEDLRRWVDHDFAIRLAKLEEPMLLPFIGCRYDDSETAIDRITTSELDNWQWAAIAAAWTDWDEAESKLSERVAGRTSAVIPMYGHADLTITAIDSALEHAGDEADLEIVVVDNGSDAATTLKVRTEYASEPRVTYLRVPRNLNFAIASNIGAIASTGEYIFFLNNDTEAREGWLAPLTEAMQDPAVLAVQPLLQFPDDSVQSAGTVFVADDSLPVPFLVNHPPEDGARVRDLDLPVLTAAALMMRASDVIALRGFDARFVNGMEDIDLCLRLHELRAGRMHVVPSSRFRHWESKTPGRGAKIEANRTLFMERWKGRLPAPNHDLYEALGLEIVAVHGDGQLPPAPRVTVRRSPNLPRRWGIRYAAIGGQKGDMWGDTWFVDSLATELRALGEEVVTYRHGANTAPSNCLDDVNLVIRGLDRTPPIPGITNILWVISHPELVTMDEIRAFDIVYAASDLWAKRMTERSGKTVHVLHQATDTSRFHLVEDAETTRGAVFVGSVHPGRARKVVDYALEAGAPITVIGNGWEGTLPEGVLEANYVANVDLPDVYRSSTVVLADHWQDMAQAGFIQNRLFDAVAVGRPVITDHVEGLEELFGGAAISYATPCELAELIAEAETGGSRIPSTEELKSIANRIIEEHSFAARAKALARAANSHKEDTILSQL